MQNCSEASLESDYLASRGTARVYNFLLDAAILRTVLAAVIRRAGKIRHNAQTDIAVEHMVKQALAKLIGIVRRRERPDISSERNDVRLIGALLNCEN